MAAKARKTCSRCGKRRLLTEFRVDRRTKDGRTRVCKPCCTEARKPSAPVLTLAPDPPPPPPKPKTIVEAAADGTTRELLAALRDRLAHAVQDPNCPPRDLASLSRRLHEITRDIEAIDAAAGEGGISDAVATPDEAFDPEAL